MSLPRKIVMDNFALRQFANKSTSIAINHDPIDFEKRVNEYYINNTNKLKDGYAPFCKHLFIENFINDLLPSAIEITDENKKFISSCYEARTEKELPVLKRFIHIKDLNIDLKPAKYLDIILYSKEQIQLENSSMNNTDPNESIEYDYGIISIKPQNYDYELPMDPITMMRNALGKEEGGSGVPLDKKKYMESVQYWDKNILLKLS